MSSKYMHILQKDERKRNYGFTKALLSLPGPTTKYLETSGMGFAKTFQTYFMIVFHRNLQRPFLVWVYSPAKRGWGRGIGEGWTKISGSTPHSSELRGSAKVPHTCQDKHLHTIFKQKEQQFYCSLYALVFHVGKTTLGKETTGIKWSHLRWAHITKRRLNTYFSLSQECNPNQSVWDYQLPLMRYPAWQTPAINQSKVT